MTIEGIAKGIVQKLVDKSVELSQGRSAGTIGFLNGEGYVDTISEIVDGGISGLPYRMMLGKITDIDGRSLLEGINQLPDNAVIITTNPGKTGLIVDTGGINIFNLPVVSIGVKHSEEAGVGIVYPKDEYFNLATKSENIQIKRLAARDMDEEREILKESSKLRLKYLDVSEELNVTDVKEEKLEVASMSEEDWQIPRVEVNSIDEEFVNDLVQKSIEVEKGREVAAIGVIEDGHVVRKGKLVVGGMGYVPSRMLASSFTDVNGISLREAYSKFIPNNVIIVHTHPGGTGVMHMGDAMAGPGTWGRPIIAIGHDKEGKVKGATVIELQNKVAELADEYEEVGQNFYDAETPEEEAKIRKRRFGIAQEYTDLCKPIKIK
ncbi:peptidase S7 [Selenihalanaerobacter shriftii]|uniref:Peptidase S7 n=1 Tax=Selenihalanaerobacter shriftii TaxID=142842 RepID=A0A1T4M8N7_9FIRM|nr:peptidase S7 [Selenihalanaerobacter shriftii]SJZ63292.1 hypothetical protein SAMN02745118_01383 [Selenihalanaerobacter shriftii]